LHIYGKFDGYTLRGVSVKFDRARLEEWIANDQAHRGTFEPGHFLGLMHDNGGRMIPDPRPTCYALEDEQGVMFYIRLARAARVDIQFGTDPKLARDRLRVARGLLKGMAFLEVALERAGVEQWIFNSQSPALRVMSEMRLGFRKSPYEMVRDIPVLELSKQGVN
jgi:hypothetical protein